MATKSLNSKLLAGGKKERKKSHQDDAITFSLCSSQNLKNEAYYFWQLNYRIFSAEEDIVK